MAKKKAADGFDFLKKKIQKHWDKSRKKKDPFKSFEAPDGVYIARLASVKAGATKNDDAYLSFQFIINSPSEVEDVHTQGLRPSVMHVFKASAKMSEEDKVDRAVFDLQKLGVETDELDLVEIKELAGSLKSNPVYVSLKVVNRDGYCNANILGLKKDYDPDEEDDLDEVEDEDDEDNEETENESEDEDNEETEDEDEEFVPEKKEEYMFSPVTGAKQKPCRVVSVSTRKKTVSVKRLHDNKIFKDITWSKLGDPVEEE